jgi:hypothetical protein
MNSPTSKPIRSVTEIERDFADLMAARLPATVAREKFERLWDETNSIAAERVPSALGEAYVLLLKHMHETFESRYREPVARGSVRPRRGPRISP